MKTLTIEVTDKQYEELLKRENTTAIIKTKRMQTPIEIIIDALFMESFGVKFKDFDLEKSELKKEEG